MSFLNPALLGGLLFFLVPILIYLIFQRKIKEMDWAAMQFLMDILEQKRKTTIEDLLLLLVRTLMLLFLALAVCRPFFNNGVVSSIVGSGSDIVILLDNSYSMDTQQGAQTRWDIAKDLSIKLIEEQNQGTGIALVLANSITEPIIADFSQDYSLIQETIREWPIGSLDSNWSTSFSVAKDLLKKGSSSSKKIYVFSDFQVNDWAELDPSTRTLIDGMSTSDSINITFISVNDQQTENISAADLRIAAGALRIGSRATFTGDIVNHGKENAEDIPVDFIVDGEVLESGTLTIAAGQKASIHFQYEALEKGPHKASIKIKGDILLKDNQAYRPFTVVDSVSVLAVTEGENEFGFLPTHFIELALNPYSDGSENEEAVYQFQNISIGELAGEDLSQHAFVCLSAIRAISTVEADILEEYVNNGGGVIIFLGQDTDVATYNANMHKNGTGLFPWELAVDSISETNENVAMSMRALNFGHPLWSGLLSPENDYLKQIKIYSAYTFIPSTKDRALTLAELLTSSEDVASGSKPLIVDFTSGRGHCIVITSSSDLSMNDFITHPVFVGFISQAVKYTKSFLHGEDVVIAGNEATRYLNFQQSQSNFQFTAPNGDSSVLSVDIKGTNYKIETPVLTESGFYTLTNQSDVEDVTLLAVSLPIKEGAIESLALVDLENLFADSSVTIANGSQSGDSIIAQSSGAEIAWILLLLVLLCWMADNYLAHRISRR